MIVVVMGVAGAGKTTVGARVAALLGVPFLDADAFHPPANVEKMRAGVPLDDNDRAPWLASLAAALAEREAAGGAVLACSALKATYREALAAPLSSRPTFVHLAADAALIAARLAERSGHFMPPSLLESQLAALEPPPDGLTVDAARTPAELAAEIVAAVRLGA